MSATRGRHDDHAGHLDAASRVQLHLAGGTTLYDFDERATTRRRALRSQLDAWPEDRRDRRRPGDRHGRSSGASLSADGTDVIPTLGAFVTLDTLDSSTNPRARTWAEVEVDRLFGDARSWTFILDGRRFQRLSDRHGLGLFSLATFQTGEVGASLPDYLQFALGGANTRARLEPGCAAARNQFIGTLEYTYVLQPVRAFSVEGLNLYCGLQVVGFADLGLAWSGDGRSQGSSRPSTATASDCGCWCRLSTSFGSTWRGASRDRARPPISACRSRPRASASVCDDGHAARLTAGLPRPCRTNLAPQLHATC